MVAVDKSFARADPDFSLNVNTLAEYQSLLNLARSLANSLTSVTS